MCKYKKKDYFSSQFLIRLRVGLSDGEIPDNLSIREYSNSYAIPNYHNLDECWLAGELHHFVLPEGAIQPRRKLPGINVFGCGLVLDPEDKLCIFFTLNGQLLGEFRMRKIYAHVNQN
jgi:hypothetical protein